MAFTKVEGGTRIRPNQHIIAAWGDEKQGKTHFALTAPGPLYIFNFDRGVDELVHKFPGKDLNIATYAMDPTSKDLAHWASIYDEFLRDWKYVVDNATGGTAVLDTGSHVWTLVQTRFLMEIKAKRPKQEVYPFDYAEANKHFEQIVQSVKDNPYLNAVLIHRAKETYNSQGQRTGQSEMAGNKDVPYLVQTVVRIYKEKEKNPETGLDTTSHKALVQSCRDNEDIEGLTFPADWDTLVSCLT